MKIEINLPDNAYHIRVFYKYKGKLGETIYAAKAIEDVKSIRPDVEKRLCQKARAGTSVTVANSAGRNSGTAGT